MQLEMRLQTSHLLIRLGVVEIYHHTEALLIEEEVDIFLKILSIEVEEEDLHRSIIHHIHIPLFWSVRFVANQTILLLNAGTY